MNNIFLGGNDPLLGNNPYPTNNPADMDGMIDRLRQQQQMLEQQKQRIVSGQQQTQQSQCPVWDEIDKVVDDMSDSERTMMSNNEEYQHGEQIVMSILNREYMKIMRPIVENSPDGKKALETLYDLVKKIKKSASEEINKNMSLFNEYTSQYADMSYAEFLEMKKGNESKKGGKK
ncbi:hypothetical protein [Parabacteroides leei]|uniref:hypothetical protein n=1 Tax=Parabacteroides leei TaxID=2939491 RepID=UPI001899056F|nr:hypothetical protein [Parabacteroides goldsteinii]